MYIVYIHHLCYSILYFLCNFGIVSCRKSSLNEFLMLEIDLYFFSSPCYFHFFNVAHRKQWESLVCDDVRNRIEVQLMV